MAVTGAGRTAVWAVRATEGAGIRAPGTAGPGTVVVTAAGTNLTQDGGVRRIARRTVVVQLRDLRLCLLQHGQ